MSIWSKALLLSTSITVCASLFACSPHSLFATPVKKKPTVAHSASIVKTTLKNMPARYKSSIEWVWKNRMVQEGSTLRKNLIFDQIFAGKGTLNYVVRWQSDKSVTLKQRQQIESMLSRQVNHWNDLLVGYENWPYSSIKVKVVGWACTNPALILNKQANEIVYTDYIIDELNKTVPTIPAKLPIAPTSLSRFEHFEEPQYMYPGGLDKRFDMYLWATTSFGGGAGGDWGQRMADDYILNILKADQDEIMEHELGHGFGFPDFYEPQDRPPGGFPDKTLMWVGSSITITNWDAWLLRYTWSQLRKDTTRFPITSFQ